MTMINWAEVQNLTRLDEFIAYSIITLQEAYTAPNNEDLDSVTKNDVSDWIRWEIAYDDVGRAFFRYAASLYVVDKNPMADSDFLSLINSPTNWLVNHSSVSIDLRTGDTSLQIDPLVDIPTSVDSMEKLLFWAVVLGDWWNQTLLYLSLYGSFPGAVIVPLGSWGSIPISPYEEYLALATALSTNDSHFDSYSGINDNPSMPSFLNDVLDNNNKGSGNLSQSIDLSSRDGGVYRENLTTCEEQDPSIKNYSQQQLETLLPTK